MDKFFNSKEGYLRALKLVIDNGREHFEDMIVFEEVLKGGAKKPAVTFADLLDELHGEGVELLEAEEEREAMESGADCIDNQHRITMRDVI